MTDTGATKNTPFSFQDIIFTLQQFWTARGCALLQPFDKEMGAGTFHPATFLRAIGPQPWRTVYVQPSRRPTDGRYGENPNRLQRYYQLQVLLKPSPDDIQDLFLDSLRSLGFDPLEHDIRFVEDNWESPTLGAWGVGWEVWIDGMEIAQFTYFQQVGGLPCAPVSGEITYGLERIAMYVQHTNNVYDLTWTDGVTYGDVYHNNEKEMSAYNFEYADTDALHAQFEAAITTHKTLIDKAFPTASYEQVLSASHAFNTLDARGAVSVTERQRFIRRIRDMAVQTAAQYFEQQTNTAR